MRQRHILKYVSILGLFSAAGSFSVQSASALEPNGPFTATSQEVSFRPDGQPFMAETIVYGTRADGSTVRVRSVVKPNLTDVTIQRSITDLIRGENIFVDGLTESITTSRLSSGHIEAARTGFNCTARPSSERDKILGFEVIKSVSDIQAPNVLRRLEQWRAPALHCFVLRERLYAGPTETDLKLQATKEVTTVKLGEPSRRFFEIPSNYKERD